MDRVSVLLELSMNRALIVVNLAMPHVYHVLVTRNKNVQAAQILMRQQSPLRVHVNAILVIWR